MTLTRRGEIVLVSLVILATLWAGGAFSHLGTRPHHATATTCTYPNADPYARLWVNSTTPNVATVYVMAHRIGTVPASSDIMRAALNLERSLCRGVGES